MSNQYVGYTGNLAGTTTTGLGTGLFSNNLAPSYTQQPAYHPMPVRNEMTERAMLAVYRRRLDLGQVAKEMPGNYDRNRKLLGDLFLSAKTQMTLCEAASLAFVLREDIESFIQSCERVGVILPGEQ